MAQRVVATRGLELVDVELKTARDGAVVRVFVDREGGIGLEELQAVSHEVSAILDVEDPMPTAYTLEVSSPGLDRPLKSARDYQKYVGRLVRLSSFEPVDGRRRWIGRLASFEAGVATVRLEAEGGVECHVPLDKIASGRLEVEFPR